MEFSRPEPCSGQPVPSPGDLLNRETEPWSPAWQEESSAAEHREVWSNRVRRRRQRVHPAACHREQTDASVPAARHREQTGVLLGLLPALGRHRGGSRMRGVCTLLHVTESKRGVLLGLLLALGRHRSGSRMRGVCTLLHVTESKRVFFSGFCQPWGDTPVGAGCEACAPCFTSDRKSVV